MRATAAVVPIGCRRAAVRAAGTQGPSVDSSCSVDARVCLFLLANSDAPGHRRGEQEVSL